jgi:hypothetical protein
VSLLGVRGVVAGGGGLLYDSGHRNQHVPAVQLEVLSSHSIADSKIAPTIKALY